MMSITSLVHALAAGRVDPVALAEDALQRARASQSVFISILADSALRQAAEAAARWKAGRPRSPMDGIPIAWKDMFDIEGSRTTAGSLTTAAGMTAKRDADTVSNARKVGLVTVGKTNLTEFAYSGLGLNPHYGTPTADFAQDEARAPGGSSSGSAIAVQRRIVPGAIGTDTAGSVRVPAAFNGLAGFRPSVGRYGLRGTYVLSRTLDTVGPIAETVMDCAWLDSALRGVTGRPESMAPIRDAHLIVDLEIFDGPGLQCSVRDNLARALVVLEGVGAVVEFRRLKSVARARHLIANVAWVGAFEALERHEDVLAGGQRNLIDKRVLVRLEAARLIPVDVRRRVFAERESLIRMLRDELGSAILVMPTVKHVAPLLKPLEVNADYFSRMNLETLSLTMIGSFLDMPGLAVPSGVSQDGLPTSLLLSMCRHHDERLLSIGMRVDSLLNAGRYEPSGIGI